MANVEPNRSPILSRKSGEQRVRFIGLDPGGKDQFGWSVVECEAAIPLAVTTSGLASNAKQAVEGVRHALGANGSVDGAGIDSPLFWVPGGERHVDRIVREAIKRAGARNAGGTVQQVNSLRGACVTQGVLAAHLLRESFPDLRITETHPKALLWLIGSGSRRRAPSVDMTHAATFREGGHPFRTEHERDAALGAFAAWSMVSGAPGWRNLALDEREAFAPVSPVEYWMPIGALWLEVKARRDA